MQIFSSHRAKTGVFWKDISPLFIYVGKEKNGIRSSMGLFFKNTDT